MSDQGYMFTEGEDLPLFSGTCPHAPVLDGRLCPIAPPVPLPFACGLCRDTGLVKVDGRIRFCTCEAGIEAYLRVHEK